MKKILKTTIFAVLASIIVLISCDTQESLTLSKPDPVFQLNTPGINAIFLNFDTPTNPAFTINWKDQLSEGGSYQIEMAKDETFGTPIQLGTTDQTNFSMTVEEFNTVLKAAGFSSFEQLPVYLRILNGDKVSNSVLLLVTSFAVNIPKITAPDATFSVTLSNADPDAVAGIVTWEDPELGVNSTANVSYTLEIASNGTSFATPSVVDTTSELSLELKHGTFNELVLALGIAAETTGKVDMRIIATIATASGNLVRTSETVTIDVTPYNTSFPYIYFVGDATTPGWNNDNNNTPLFRSQDTPNSYFYTGYFNSGAFKLLETKGQWQPQWGTNDGSTLAVNDGTGSDPGTFNVGAAGYYTYTFSSLSPGTSFTVTSYDASSAPTYSVIGLIGNATPGGWGAQTSLTQDPNNPHLWYINGITLTNGGEFLIRANDNWSDAIWRYTDSKELFGTALLAGSGNNFPFTGETGSYDVWFNDLDGSYVIIPN